MAGALCWAGAYIAAGWLFRRQLEDVVAALSRFGAAIGVVVGSGLVLYLVSKFVRMWRQYRAYRTQRITPRELKQRMESGEPVVVVDLRAEFEKQHGKIPGALAVAYRDLDSLLPSIGTKEVVFYCSCPDELTSVRASLRLKSHGLTRVHALLGGFSGWQALGFPVDTAPARVAGA